MKPTTLISFVLLAAASAPAAANPANELEQAIAAYAGRVENFKDYALMSKAIDKRYPIGGCHAAIVKAREAGVEATIAQQTTCKDFVAYHQLAEAHAVLSPAQDWLDFLAVIDVGTNNVANGPRMIADAGKCNAEMDRLLAGGIPTNIVISVGSGLAKDFTMADAKAKVCAPLAKAGATFAKDVVDAKAQRYAEAAAPYKKVGIGGDRLELLVDHIDYAMYGKGGGELTTPKQLKSAAVIFELLGPGTDGLYTLRRYQFKGDTLVSTTSADFLFRPAAKYYR